MKFNDLDKRMRVFETSLDQIIAPEIYIVARLDGRGFTKLTKETLQLEKPFDAKFRDAMIATVKHLMDCGIKIIYGYNESDEISLLFHLKENSFKRKTRKYISILAGEASSKFSLEMGHIAAFDCRLCPLPNIDLVVDYFRWRSEDAHRNSLSAYCYWKLRLSGKSVNEATEMVSGKSVAEKNEILFQLGINYNELPAWQKRGMGFYYKDEIKESINPLTNIQTEAKRRSIYTDLELPTGDSYGEFIRRISNKNLQN